MYIINEFVVNLYSAGDIAAIIVLAICACVACAATIINFCAFNDRTCTALGVAATILCAVALVCYIASPSVPYRCVDAILDETAPYIAVMDKYKVVESRGLLYTLREKEPLTQETEENMYTSTESNLEV